jgi:tRNA-dihydrouridine synthase C
MIDPQRPALVLAPMEGITDAPMREFMGASGAFSYAVSEFIRVSVEVLPAKAIRRWVPELDHGARTVNGLPVQVQILGGDPDRVAASAQNAVAAGALAIDLNFGCPAKTVNRHDGGATLLKYPKRIEELVGAVVSAVSVPVSAKLRLGWDDTAAIHENAERAVTGGARWITIHARTRMQGYLPPVNWSLIGEVRRALNVPVVANGDIWTLDDFRRCQEMTGCHHFMIGRSALANPRLPLQIACDLGISTQTASNEVDWIQIFGQFCSIMGLQSGPDRRLLRLKQWMKLAHLHGEFPHFDALKTAATVDELLTTLARLTERPTSVTM